MEHVCPTCGSDEIIYPLFTDSTLTTVYCPKCGAVNVIQDVPDQEEYDITGDFTIEGKV